jgi:ElaB/YqjD/DUF883 family membrane-anchored ribosome-binding protein
MTSPTQAKFQEDLDNIASQLHLGVQSGNYSWADVQERLRTKTSELASATDECLHEYTWTSLGVVAGLGVLLGFFVGRR